MLAFYEPLDDYIHNFEKNVSPYFMLGCLYLFNSHFYFNQ